MRRVQLMTIWQMLEQCVSLLDEPFRRSEIVGWFRRHHPEVKEQSLGAHIQGATAGAPGRGPFESRRPSLSASTTGSTGDTAVGWTTPQSALNEWPAHSRRPRERT